jgi:hypothetical protein
VHAARPTNVTVEMHLVQAGESEWIVASGRCDIPALAHAAVNCGPLRHPMNKGRYYAFATDASGTLAATPLVSQ